MEEEFVEIEVEDSSLYEDDEIDVNYEFDAPRFYDFTQQETFWDACEAEQWFEFAESYPPSPFLMKLRWGNANEVGNVNVCVEPEQVSAIEDSNSRGLEYCDQTTQDTLEGKTETLKKSSSAKSKVFTFMKPTASHLAKQKNPPPEVPTSRRIQKESFLSIDCQLSKRQKLEAGYLRKIARLKHQTLFTHKKTKEVDRTEVNLASKPNVTVPREPNLQTALRAQRHKSRANTESSQQSKSSSQVIKARPLNKKGEATLNNNSISNIETRTNTSVNKLRDSPHDKQVSSKAKRGVFRNIKVFPLEPNDKGFQDEPPTELLSKLSLVSQAKQTTKLLSKEQPISKGLKENRPRNLHQEYEIVLDYTMSLLTSSLNGMNFVKEETQRLYGKQYQCANEIGSLVTKQNYMLELGH